MWGFINEAILCLCDSRRRRFFLTSRRDSSSLSSNESYPSLTPPPPYSYSSARAPGVSAWTTRSRPVFGANGGTRQRRRFDGVRVTAYSGGVNREGGVLCAREGLLRGRGASFLLSRSRRRWCSGSRRPLRRRTRF